MAFLVVFALLAGAGTALSPCVLPVLPALLSRRRDRRAAPAARASSLGLAATFTVTIVGLGERASTASAWAGDALRTLAIVVLLGFGSRCSCRARGARVSRRRWRGSPRFGPRAARGDGFSSGPARRRRAGLRLRAVRGPDPRRGHHRRRRRRRARSPSALAYALGSALVLLALALGGRRLVERAAARRPRPGAAARARRACMIAHRASRWRPTSTCASRRRSPTTCPPSLVNPTHSLETLARRRQPPRRPARPVALRARGDRATRPSPAASCRELGAAPDFTGNQRWFNTPGGRPLTLRGLRGRVVLVDFWTYTCINCLRTLPVPEGVGRALPRRRADDRRRPLARVRVRAATPATSPRAIARERHPLPGRAGQRLRHLERLRQPVLAGRVPDRRARPRALRALRRGRLRQDRGGDPRAAGRGRAPQRRRERRADGARRHAGARVTTPETYLGAGARRASTAPPLPGHARPTRAPPALAGQTSFALGGTWTIGAEAATAGAGAAIHARAVGQGRLPRARPAAAGRGTVRVAARRPADRRRRAGADVHGGVVRVDRQRLYHLVSRPRPEHHVLSCAPSPGVRATRSRSASVDP